MNSPQVTVSPAHNRGQPSMRGVTTGLIADAYWLGENVADEYGLRRHELLVALWFEASQGQQRFRQNEPRLWPM
ncbi:hypothetical protein AMIS_20610 [Actinoplanes missouriensis 431]|uniref:Uncharacterized protein n=1 Tax=Actinoplanes missouriensis (strain ATCC 14538 / DSM 43046 / CBS 188.64 / JCM 3121 / NBRC 102363 / NCIMB 12654 / NRRL B-3342 / UNCC 431) TaxID=512565 RepID=I0H2P4_ACTM4|nr:hypothetical protein [Actinoplanes missouriensis]BAL87281.1 hypothetical protein AMIS_20610 [Actinoplanes missouriensis 431]